MRRHVRAIAPVDDQRFLGAQALRGARRIHRRVAAAVDDDAPPEARRVAGRHVVQKRDGVEHARSVARRNIDMFADARSDRDEYRVEIAGRLSPPTTSTTLWFSTIVTPMASMRAISRIRSRRGSR